MAYSDHPDCLNARFRSQAKLGLAWDKGLMTTGQVALYSVYIGHTEHDSFGGSHEHLFSAS